ncbi:MAG: hypothetical protein K1X64_07825 [Myxococcaceae bacterium]|nr:hypothetical protein [Myxococcaceae bacterium]
MPPPIRLLSLRHVATTATTATIRSRQSEKSNVFAAIDMGSSSTKMLIVKQTATGKWRTVLDVKEGTRLGKDIGADRVLPKENQERALTALTQFIVQAQKHGVPAKEIGFITTAVMRNTVNGATFAAQIEKTLGLKPRILTGREEAQLGYLGAIRPFRHDGSPARFASLDLGGGSFQLAIGTEAHMQRGASTQVGSNHVLEAYFPHERIDAAGFKRADEALKKIAPMPMPAQALANRQLVATGGISKFLRTHFGKDEISRAEIDGLRRKVGALSYRQRVAVVTEGKSATEKRALGIDTPKGAKDYGIKLPASATLLLRILDGLHVDKVRVSETDARHALIEQRQAQATRSQL